jgi:alkylation response protein AidB-like acyl-CoA dehydrogenase
MIDSEDAGLLRGSAKGFLADKAPASQLRRLRDHADPLGHDQATWDEMCAMGWPGVLVAEEHGGLGMGAMAAGILAEEMGRTLTASPFFSSSVLGASALAHGSDALKRQWLTQIASGEGLVSLALDEGRHHNPAQTAMQAERRGNGFVLNGVKTFVLDGHIADAFIVAARTCGAPGIAEGLTLFLVEADRKGVVRQRTIMVDSRNAATLSLDNLEVTADAVIGEVDDAMAVLRPTLRTGRSVLAAEMLGASKEAFDRTREYLTQREQFGAMIGSFQALQHRAAHLWAELQLLDAVVAKALADIDKDDPGAELTSALAKAKAGSVGRLATQEALQMHGGIGMTDDHEIGFFMKRIRAASACLGGTGFHGEAFARLRGF